MQLLAANLETWTSNCDLETRYQAQLTAESSMCLPSKWAHWSQTFLMSSLPVDVSTTDFGGGERNSNDDSRLTIVRQGTIYHHWGWRFNPQMCQRSKRRKKRDDFLCGVGSGDIQYCLILWGQWIHRNTLKILVWGNGSSVIAVFNLGKIDYGWLRSTVRT